MDWQLQFLSKRDQEKVADAIKKAEKKTSVEIVPLIVRKCSSTHHVFLFLLLFVFCVTLTFEAWLGPIYAAISFALTLALAVLLNKFEWVHRWLTPQSELDNQTNLRAELEFWREGLHETQGRTGILIFIALFEHKVIVLGDQSVKEHFEEKDWQEAVDIVLKNIKDGDPAEGLVQAINKILGVVKTEFPPAKKNKNELADHVLFKE